MQELDSKPLHIKKPGWLKTKIPTGKTYFDIKKKLRGQNLVTVCEEAKCPNIGECWNTGTATFMILGDTCTRACRFCHIKTGNPKGQFDPQEAEKIAGSCFDLQLRYVVLTMVDRDDMEDGGSLHVHNVIKAIKNKQPQIRTEVLAGDFSGKEKSLKEVLAARPDVFAHNIETVESLTPRVRDRRASYQQSLTVLKNAKKFASYPIITKSSLMLGLGETEKEVLQAFKDLRAHDVDFLTLGQYMRPTKKHLSVKEWVNPKIFERLELMAKQLGFLEVAAGPLVRSSYKAQFFYDRWLKKNEPLETESL